MNKRIDSISGLAGFAALMVIYAHMGTEGFLHLTHHFHNLGVMIFFSMSGFLLSYLYLEKSFCAEEVTSYCLARFTRIAPSYLFTILAAFIIYNFFDPDFVYQMSIDKLPRHLLFMGNESVFWTIGPQVQFYGLFLVLWCATAYYTRQRDSLPLIIMLFVSVGVMLLRDSFPGTFVASNLHFFVFGALAGTVRRKMKTEFRHPWLMNLVHLSLLALFLSVELGLAPVSHEMLTENLNEIVLAMLIAFFLFSFSFNSLTERVLFGNPLLQLMGKYSFSLYLLHMPVLYWAKKIFPNDVSNPLVAAGTFVAILLLASLYFVTVERYCTLLVKNLGKKYSREIEGAFLRVGIQRKGAIS